jgi:hypothetical protein
MPEPKPRDIAVVAMAALLFANAESRSDDQVKAAFSDAERFVAEVEKRYGRLEDMIGC